MPQITSLGTHTVVDLYECDAVRLNDGGAIREMMVEAARRAGATIVGEAFQSFSPQGVTGVVILAESHLAIHTWPERGFAAVDLFTCGRNMNVDSCFPYIVEELRAARHSTTTLARGADASTGAAD
jgi:S-adenosylmethionine decarboxylase proenzyme